MKLFKIIYLLIKIPFQALLIPFVYVWSKNVKALRERRRIEALEIAVDDVVRAKNDGYKVAIIKINGKNREFIYKTKADLKLQVKQAKYPQLLGE